MHIRAFIGGPEGDPFASLIQHGIEQARDELGAKVDIIYSNWDSDLLLKQVKEAIAIKPDGMAINGLPGHDALVPIARDLQAKGILFNFIVVDSGNVHKDFGGGYFGVADPYAQGKGMAEKAIKSFGLKSKDRVLVMGAWDLDQHVRESGVADTFEKAGCTVDKITITHGAGGINSDPNLLTPILTAYQLAHPETKLWSFQGGNSTQTWLPPLKTLFKLEVKKETRIDDAVSDDRYKSKKKGDSVSLSSYVFTSEYSTTSEYRQKSDYGTSFVVFGEADARPLAETRFLNSGHKLVSWESDR